MSALPPLIADPADVTPEWLTDALRSAGLDVTVAKLEREAVGTGQMAHNERFFLHYEGTPEDAPPTLVGKFPSPSEESRAAGASGGYRNEVRFYLDLAPRVHLRVPRCYYGAISDDSSTFTLLLEDMAPASQGDQIRGASEVEIEAALIELAGLHAPLWESPELDSLDFLAGGIDGLAVDIVRAVTPLFLERYADRLSAAVIETAEGFAAGVDRWLAEFPPSRTLVHGDYRLDNLLFGPEGSGAPPVTAVDWQTLSVATAGRDVAFLLGTSCEAPVRRASEASWLDAYRGAMARHGVERSAEQVRDDYRHGSFQGLYITMLGSMAVGRTERGDTMFVAMAERSTALVRDHDALALIG